jgi:hypothetical protein
MMGDYTVITTMKNEGAFLVEWIAHHKALGFDNILICTNDCKDPTTLMALRLQEMGLVRHHATRHWPATSIQRSALKQARRYPEVAEAAWIYVCDADEFLVVHFGDGSVRALVSAATEGTEVISVPWRIFGSAGQADYRDLPVTTQFPFAEKASPGMAVYPKALFRGLENVHRIGIHGPVPRADLGRKLRRELPGGAPYNSVRHPLFVLADYRFAQINHYALRSRASFLVKRERGRVNHMGQDMGLDYWDRFERCDLACKAIRRYDPQVAEWRQRLMADEILADLHNAAVRWHRKRARKLKSHPDWADFVAQIAQRQAALCLPQIAPD